MISDDERARRALLTVARHFIARTIELVAEDGAEVARQEYSDLSDDDWDEVVCRAVSIAGMRRPWPDQYQSAVAILAARADKEQ